MKDSPETRRQTSGMVTFTAGQETVFIFQEGFTGPVLVRRGSLEISVPASDLVELIASRIGLKLEERLKRMRDRPDGGGDLGVADWIWTLMHAKIK